MKEFYPWSIAAYRESVESYKLGEYPILDIQLSGACNYNCVYCDSPDRDLPSNIDFNHLEELIYQGKGAYRWMFICGLGEPLWGQNKDQLLRLLEICKKLNMKCTIFTNGSNIDDFILEFVRAGILFPLIKIDTFSLELSSELYGTPQASKNLDAIEALFAISKETDGDYYPVAASIVPTSRNIKELLDIVERCIENHVFPLLGQLEYAGKAISNYDDLLLSKNELYNIKDQISEFIGTEYKVPICPSVISGIHINNDGFVSVDKKSGLSCSWFWLETPQTVNLCKINSISSLKRAEEKITEYRQKVSPNLGSLLMKIEEYPFGGCGGNIKDLFGDYVKLVNTK